MWRSRSIIQRVRHFSTSQLTSNPPVIFVLGGPGSGKGTQCQMLIKAFNTEEQVRLRTGFNSLSFFSVGDLLRAALASPEKHPENIIALIRQTFSNGSILPGFVTVALLKEAISSARTAALAAGLKPLFLIDGFPRNMNNVAEYETQIGEAKQIIALDCPPSILLNRILHRGKSGQRSDDTEEIAKKRLESFNKETSQVYEHFAATASKRLIMVDGSGSVEQVHSTMRGHFEQMARSIDASV